MKSPWTWAAIALSTAAACGQNPTVGPDWSARLVAEPDCGQPGARLRELEFRKQGERPFEVHALILRPEKFRVTLADQPEESLASAPSVAVLAKRAGAFAALNGGYFHADFSPAGLFRLAGKDLSPLSPEPVQSGILAHGADGRLALEKRKAPRPGWHGAVQAGPFLIDPGSRMGIGKNSGQRARRSVVALSRKGDWLAISTEPVTLFDLAWCLAHRPSDFGVGDIERALNLDGGPSTALFIAMPTREVWIPSGTPIRNAVLFLPRGD